MSLPEPQAVAWPVWRLSPAQRLGVACGGLLFAAIGLWAGVLGPLTAYAAPHVPWWALAIAFFATERWPLTVTVRRGMPSLGMAAAPLVIGLFYSTPIEVLGAAVLGVVAAAALRNPRDVRRAGLDVAQLTVLIAISEVLFRATAGAGSALWHQWLAALAAAALFVGGTHLTVAGLAVVQARMRWDTLRTELGYAAAGSAASAGFGLITVELIQVGPQALPVVALVGLGFLLGYRMYVRERLERLSLEFLHAAGDALSSPDLETGQLQLLRRVQAMFNGELAQLTIFPSLPEEKAFRTTVRVDHPDQAMVPLSMAELDDVLEAETDGAIVDRWRSSPAAIDMLSRRGVNEAMVALLRGQTRILGSLVVGGHLDPRSYDDADLRLFRALAVQTSAALENGRLERSISRLTDLQEQLAHQSFHDSLTNLANRSLFTDRIEHALMRGARGGRAVAVLFIDVDDFRGVNDTYGHACGDGLLVGLADRLRTILRRPDTAARLGGDEFAVLLEDLDDASEAEIVGRRIFEALRAPYEVNGQAVNVRVSIGVALAEHGADNAGNLMRHADVAMYAAKGAGKDRRVLFAPGMETDIVGRHRLRGELEEALTLDQFVVHYQPIVDLVTGELAGMEALVRWRHPARGLVGPSEFVPMAEESGLILQLGDHVLRTACNALLRLQARHPRRNAMSVAVNISARQLQQPLFVENVLSIVSDSGLLPHAVTLELTESILLEDAPSHIVKLEALQRAGIRIAVDDFGTGYSSLSYLRRLPVDVLKIAKPFVDDLAAEHPNSDFVRAIVGLGSALRLGLVAEGIESPPQVWQLRDLGCSLGQGYYLCHPVALDEIDAILRRGGIDQSRLHPEGAMLDQVIPIRRR
jgi:diguanylate cyclase (GGDEF)-like protein